MCIFYILMFLLSCADLGGRAAMPSGGSGVCVFFVTVFIVLHVRNPAFSLYDVGMFPLRDYLVFIFHLFIFVLQCKQFELLSSRHIHKLEGIHNVQWFVSLE